MRVSIRTWLKRLLGMNTLTLSPDHELPDNERDALQNGVANLDWIIGAGRILRVWWAPRGLVAAVRLVAAEWDDAEAMRLVSLALDQQLEAWHRHRAAGETETVEMLRDNFEACAWGFGLLGRVASEEESFVGFLQLAHEDLVQELRDERRP